MKNQVNAFLKYLNLPEENSFFLIGGPCVVENEATTLHTAEKLKKICAELKVPFIFKSSYRKANRTKLDSFETIGIDKALKILQKAKTELEIKILTDFHNPNEITLISEVADVIQIPAFLCRQTDMLKAAALSKKPVNLKKGQFMSGYSILFSANKIKSFGNSQILITERGNFFGYTDLVVDFRNLLIISKSGYIPVIDATHSLQTPNLMEGYSGGKREFAEVIARCGIVSGSYGVFMEIHPDPSSALSDKDTQIPLNIVKDLLQNLKKIWDVISQLHFVSIA